MQVRYRFGNSVYVQKYERQQKIDDMRVDIAGLNLLSLPGYNYTFKRSINSKIDAK